MLVKVNVLSPFRYEYRGKYSWVATGEFLILDTSNKDQRSELLHLLSSNFTYKEFIHIDIQTLPEDIRCESEANIGMYKLPITPIEIVKEPQPTEFFNTLADADPNPYIKPVINSIIDDREVLVKTSLSNEDICLDEDTEDTEVSKSLLERQAELSQTPWLKVKEIAESYGITYTNKSESIDLILEKEFKDF